MPLVRLAPYSKLAPSCGLGPRVGVHDSFIKVDCSSPTWPVCKARTPCGVVQRFACPLSIDSGWPTLGTTTRGQSAAANRITRRGHSPRHAACLRADLALFFCVPFFSAFLHYGFWPCIFCPFLFGPSRMRCGLIRCQQPNNQIVIKTRRNLV